MHFPMRRKAAHFLAWLHSFGIPLQTKKPKPEFKLLATSESILARRFFKLKLLSREERRRRDKVDDDDDTAESSTIRSAATSSSANSWAVRMKSQVDSWLATWGPYQTLGPVCRGGMFTRSVVALESAKVGPILSRSCVYLPVSSV